MFDAKLFLRDNFKTKLKLIELVERWGIAPPSVYMVDKWWQRGSVPSDWLPVLIYVLESERGTAPQLANYIKAGGPDAKGKH